MHLWLPNGGLQRRQSQALLQNISVLGGGRSQDTSLPPPPPAHITVGSAPQAATGHMKGFALWGGTPDPAWLQEAGGSSPIDISSVHTAVKLGESDGQDDAGQQEDGAPAQAEPEGVLGVGGEPSEPRQ